MQSTMNLHFGQRLVSLHIFNPIYCHTQQTDKVQDTEKRHILQRCKREFQKRMSIQSHMFIDKAQKFRKTSDTIHRLPPEKPSYSGSQESSCILWNPEVYQFSHYIGLYISHPFIMPMSSTRLISFRFPYQSSFLSCKPHALPISSSSIT
jgi:hypothetical protein